MRSTDVVPPVDHGGGVAVPPTEVALGRASRIFWFRIFPLRLRKGRREERREAGEGEREEGWRREGGEREEGEGRSGEESIRRGRGHRRGREG